MRFGEHFRSFFRFCCSSEYAKFISSLTSLRIDHQLTQIILTISVPGQQLNAHLDLGRGATGFFRPLTQIIHLSKNWQPEFGSRFILSEFPTLVPPVLALDPKFNTTVLWKRTSCAWHGVTKLQSDAPQRRFIGITFQARDLTSYAYAIKNSALGKVLAESGVGRVLRKLIR